MWSEKQVLSGSVIGSSGAPGVWTFGYTAVTLIFYKDVRITHVNISSIVTDATPGALQHNSEMYINRVPDKQQNRGTFGSVIHGFNVGDGANLDTDVQIDIPANTSVQLDGVCYLFAAAGSPADGITHWNITYMVKHFAGA